MRIGPVVQRTKRWFKVVVGFRRVGATCGVRLVERDAVRCSLGWTFLRAEKPTLAPLKGSARNDKHYSGGITHRGSKHLRAMLAEAAWMAVPRVPVYRAMFDRIAQKKNKLVAVTAVARRMLEDSFTMLKRDEAFRYVGMSVADAPQQVAAITATPTSSRNRKVASSVAG